MLTLHIATVLAVVSCLEVITAATVSQQCLDCICYASSGCDVSKKCHNGENGGYFCGPYQISWPYWSDGGKLGYRGGPADFENCLNNKQCAEATVVGYMNKWGADCNRDGQIDCMDYAAIHVTGGSNCRANWLENSGYWRAFKRTSCYRGPETSNEGPPRPRDLPSSGDRGVVTINGGNNNGNPNLAPTIPRDHRNDGDDSNGDGEFFVENGGPINPAPINPPSRPPPRPQPRPQNIPRPQPPPPPRPTGPSSGRAPGSRVSWNFSNGTTVSNFPNNPNFPRNNPNFPGNSPPRRENFPNGFVSTPRPVTVNRPITPFRPPTPNVPVRTPLEPLDIALPPVRSPPQPRPQPQPQPANPNPIGFSPNSNGIVSKQCLKCLCTASTGCDLSKQCAGDFCGPYLISWSYWADGGKPGNDFVSCSLNAQCAEAAIQGYMNKWQRDCNGDGLVDCDDYAAIHKLGPHQCRNEAVGLSDYWRAYEQCGGDGPRGASGEDGAGVIEARSLTGRSVELNSNRDPRRGAESILSPAESIPLSRSHGHSNVIGRPSSGTLPINVPLVDLREREHNLASNAINLPIPTKPPTSSRPSLFGHPFEFGHSTPRPDLPLITPRRNLYSRGAFRRGRYYGGVTEKPTVEVTDECMACICEASSGCSFETKCEEKASDTKLCGPYQLDRNYWTAAGSPGYRGAALDFERCSGEKECAETTVKRFLAKMAFDCNEDGNIDCLDLAAVHKGGPKACNSQWFLDSSFWSEFQQCYGFAKR